MTMSARDDELIREHDRLSDENNRLAQRKRNESGETENRTMRQMMENQKRCHEISRLLTQSGRWV